MNDICPKCDSRLYSSCEELEDGRRYYVDLCPSCYGYRVIKNAV